MQTAKIEVARKKYPHEARRPFRTIRTGRPGGSGAQPPLHLIHMVRVALMPNSKFRILKRMLLKI